MKKSIISKIVPAIILIAFSSGVYGQQEGPLKKLESMRIAFITEKLDLSSSEAEKFWPVYRDYANRNDRITEERRSLYRYASKNAEYISESEINELLEKHLNLQKEESNLTEKFNSRFLQILPPKKVLILYTTENQFKTFILNQIMERPRPGQQGQRRRFIE